MAKGVKTGGRTKGTPNKRSQHVEEIASRFKLDPFELLMMVVSGDWKGLGYDSPSTTSYSPAGIEFEELNITLDHRIQAAKEASKYLYSQKKAVEISSAEDTGIKIIVEDYTKSK